MFRKLFGKREEPVEAEPLLTEPEGSVSQSEAAVWEMLQTEWHCSHGHEARGKPMDLAAHAPDPFPQDREYEPNSALRFDEDFLSEDFCILKDGENVNYFIRGVMEFPISGTDEIWGFGCWSTLSPESFDKYLDGFDAGVYPDEGPWFGWLCNRLLPVFPGPDPLALAVCPQPDRQRPRLLVRDDDQPLAIYQDEGLPPSVLLQVLEAYGLGPKVN